jgi:membrane associated rhomboid family serine protease
MANFRQGGFSQMPIVVKNLIIINVLVFLLQNVIGAQADDYLALHFITSPYFKWWQLFTHMFMHANLMHIFFNMFALWMFGSILENVFGSAKFLTFYLICGLGAAICHLSVLGLQFHNFQTAFLYYQEHPNITEYSKFLAKANVTGPAFGEILRFWNDTPDCSNCAQQSIESISQLYLIKINEATVGASGAVFGLLFAFGYLFPNTELMLLFPPIPIKAKWFVTGYAAIELVMGIQNSSTDNIAHFAHLGGMLFAFILLRVWNTRRTGW